MTAALDLWTLFVVYVFGNLTIAMLGIGLLLFVILGVLGRISIYTTMWFCLLFVSAIALGAGWVLLNLIITLILLIAAFFSWKSYLDSK